jgi:hypothetical protein
MCHVHVSFISLVIGLQPISIALILLTLGLFCNFVCAFILLYALWKNFLNTPSSLIPLYRVGLKCFQKKNQMKRESDALIAQTAKMPRFRFLTELEEKLFLELGA